MIFQNLPSFILPTSNSRSVTLVSQAFAQVALMYLQHGKTKNDLKLFINQVVFSLRLNNQPIFHHKRTKYWKCLQSVQWSEMHLAKEFVYPSTTNGPS